MSVVHADELSYLSPITGQLVGSSDVVGSAVGIVSGSLEMGWAATVAIVVVFGVPGEGLRSIVAGCHCLAIVIHRFLHCR